VVATIRKELLLLLRDPGGLLLLLIMPAALIIVMALVQDAPYRDYQEMKFEIMVANKDKGSVGTRIIEGLKKNRSFVVIDKHNSLPLQEKDVQEDLQKGKYQIGIVIPENATASLVNTSNKLANDMARSMGLSAALPVKESADSTSIRLLFDPVVKPAFRTSLNFALNQYITQVKIEILMERMRKMNGITDDTQMNANALNVLSVQEESLNKGMQISPSMNSVQHNVPAWTIFGMFLIVVPISGNMIRERDEGSALRIRLIPTATKRVGIGKIIFYIMVCMLQFFVMLLVGIFLLPSFGLPRLNLGPHPEALLPIAFAISFAAVSYGYFIGSIFKTANQAMPFGAISIVLFSAMGGVWVPVEILPEMMQKVALFSPLHWSLEGVNEVILRGRGISGILMPFAILIGLASLLSILPVYFGKK
jgi:ABC-2 type transport system permease protein